MKHIFIVNKISGKGHAYNSIKLIEKVAKEEKIDYTIEVTQYASHAKEIVKKYYDQEDIILYSVGGDGTFLEIVNEMNPLHEVAVIPCGSGNDFYRYFGGVNENIEEVIRNTIEAKPFKIDIGQSEFMKFVNTASIGIDAKINSDASRLIRKTFITKGPAYLLSIIWNMIILKKIDISLFVDGKDFSGQYYLVSCMNGKYYGNGVKVAPNADLSDGYFDLSLFKIAPRFKTYKTLVKFLKGNFTAKDGIQHIRCKEIFIKSKNKFAAQQDGENFYADELNIKILPKEINLKVWPN